MIIEKNKQNDKYKVDFTLTPDELKKLKDAANITGYAPEHRILNALGYNNELTDDEFSRLIATLQNAGLRVSIIY